jgi:3D (Asp-Asp-Asp) domain-containing protein
VANYGFAIAADVGGAIRGYHIDLYMYDHEEARRFGRRFIDVYVLK